jgi:hypothetical protein
MTKKASLGSAEVRIHALSNSYQLSRAARALVSARQGFDRHREAARSG